MQTRTKWVLFNWSVLIAGIIFILSLHIFRQKKSITNEIVKENDNYRIGEISINSDKTRIQFKAEVFKNKGRVQHLIYLQGYKWLKGESAIVSEAKLADLQRAIAFVDENMWNDLRYGRPENDRLIIFMKWDNREILGDALVVTEDKLEIRDFIFLGSPTFDPIVLNFPKGIDCSVCSIFPLEQKVISEGFRRKSGDSGYVLDDSLFPPQGKEVLIIIQLKDEAVR